MKLFKFFATSSALLCALLVQALPSDRNQAIIIESDSAERNEKTGLTQYRGNVLVRQGSMVIDADQVTIHYIDDKVNRIICLGTPASYQQKPHTDGSLVVAKAETIEYLLATDEINLKIKASLSRDGTLIKGDSINYDLNNQTWKAKGDHRGDQKRIQLVIPPSTQVGSKPVTEIDNSDRERAR